MKKGRVIERWKAEKIYPYTEKQNVSPIEEAERQVFDIVAVSVENNLPKFKDGPNRTKKLTFSLIAQALKTNPDSVQHIITEVLNLKKEDQDALAALMKKTTLSKIIHTSKIVADRLDFLVALEELLFDKESKKKLLERDQLHKILESEAWLFDEEFALSASEARLEEVLKLHLGKLGNRSDEPVFMEGEKQGRVDLMFSRSNQPRHDEKDHLVVELKRPSKKIDSEVLTQVKAYAFAIANDNRFQKEKTRWRVIAVSNEFDAFAKSEANQRNRPKGLVHDNDEMNLQVWAFTWTEIIAKARARLQFINTTLNYEADLESAKDYLHRAHEKYIPVLSHEASLS